MKSIQKHIVTITKSIGAVKAERDKLEARIEARNDKFNDASEKWQESEKCSDFENKTTELEDELLEIDTVIEDFEGALEALQEFNNTYAE